MEQRHLANVRKLTNVDRALLRVRRALRYNLLQNWTWVGSIHGSGLSMDRVGLGHKILRLEWVGLGRVQCQ